MKDVDELVLEEAKTLAVELVRADKYQINWLHIRRHGHVVTEGEILRVLAYGTHRLDRNQKGRFVAFGYNVLHRGVDIRVSYTFKKMNGIILVIITAFED